ncbi:MAG TPA: hypothetical protein VKX49_18210 [Bryobacteraceae bacterium]|nr:hypothetical protein [Bryobacteraceae bacterium]
MEARSRFLRRAEPFFDSLALFFAAAALIWPLFKAGYLAYWGSIESTFIADPRFLIEHWPHPQWQPLWYAGTRWDYLYPPALRYGTALTSMISGYPPVRAYHVYTAFFYCVGIAGVYFLVRTGSGSRAAAYLAAAASALLSPSFLFLPALRHDSPFWSPQRLHVLVVYGEGPHITSVALLPFALAFAWRALEPRKAADLALGSIFCAAVVSHNFYGATSLAIFYPILVWSIGATRKDWGWFWRAAAIPALAYGLTAFWFTPSYFKVTSANLRLVAEPGNTWSMWVAVAVGVVFAFITWRLARGRRDRAWPLFVCGAALFFAVMVLGYSYLHFLVSGNPIRLVPELDLALILAGLLVLHWLWRLPGILGRAVCVILAAGFAANSLGYVRHAWTLFPLSPDYWQRVEYKIPEWIGNNMPHARVHAIGSVRLWLDPWNDLAQLGGGSDQGLINRMAVVSQWEVTQGQDPAAATLWLQAMGVDAVYVSDRQSQEIYKDFANPAKFRGVLPVLYDDEHGDTIYRVPRRYLPRVRVVETPAVRAAAAPRFGEDFERLRAYVDAIERGPDSPATLASDEPETMRVRATVRPGQSILVQESYDPAWHAWSGGRSLQIHPDAMGFMLVDTPPGVQDVSLVFVTPFENQIGRAVTLASVVICIALLAFGKRAIASHG